MPRARPSPDPGVTAIPTDGQRVAMAGPGSKRCAAWRPRAVAGLRRPQPRGRRFLPGRSFSRAGLPAGRPVPDARFDRRARSPGGRLATPGRRLATMVAPITATSPRNPASSGNGFGRNVRWEYAYQTSPASCTVAPATTSGSARPAAARRPGSAAASPPSLRSPPVRGLPPLLPRAASSVPGRSRPCTLGSCGP
jgi:hypothetical protein